MTKGKTILTGLLVLVLFAALVGAMNLPTIFAQGNGQGNLSESSNLQMETVKVIGGPGIPEVIGQAVEQGIITQEQADQVLADFQDVAVSFGSVEGTAVAAGGQAGAFNVVLEGNGPYSGRIIIFQRVGDENPAQLPNELQNQLQEAVAAGLLTQAEADQLWADLQSGVLNFLAITDEAVYTDPNDLPEGLEVPPMPEGAFGTAIISSDANPIPEAAFGPAIISSNATVMAGPAFTIAGQPFMAAALQELLNGAVNEGVISQAQADQIQALGEQIASQTIFFSGPAGTAHLPNFLLLEEIGKALQEAVSNGKVSQETADSLLQQLTEAISD